MLLNLLIVIAFIGFAIYTFYDPRLSTRQRNYNAIADLIFALGILLSLFNGIVSAIGNGIVIIIFIYSCYQWYRARH